MRTLFLFGILVALAVIAMKEPGETGLEAARGLADKATDVAAEIKEAVEAVPAVALVLDKKPKPDEAANRKLSDQIDDALNDLSEVEQGLANNEAGLEDDKQSTFEKSARFNEEVDAIREEFTSSSDLPPIERAPVIPVTTEYPGTGSFSLPTPSETTVTAPAFTGDDFAEVKDFYENASRLLAEME